MKIGILAMIALILTAIFHPGSVAGNTEKPNQPKLPNVGDYWVVNPDVCSLAWESQIWGSRAFEEVRRISGRTTVLVCVNGVGDPKEWIADWANAQLGSSPTTVWVIRPDQPPEDRLFAWSSDDRIPNYDVATKMAAMGRYLSTMEEIVKIFD